MSNITRRDWNELLVYICLLYPKVKITFVDKDAPLAVKIKEVLGAGTLEYPKDAKYVNLLFQDVNSILPPHSFPKEKNGEGS